MRALLQRRIIPYMIIAVMITVSIFVGTTSRAKGDSVFSLYAGSATENSSETAIVDYASLNLSAGSSDVIEAFYLYSEDDVEEAKAQIEEELQAEREARYTLAMAKTSDYVNVRNNPGTDGEKVGVLYKNCGGTVLERGDGWTKIESGEVVGWVSNDFLYQYEEAESYAEEVCKKYANVDTQALRIRKAPGEDTEILGLLETGTDLEIIPESEPTEGWLKVIYQGKEGYVSADYVTVERYINEGETIEEIEERERLAAMEKSKLVTKYGSVAANVDDTTLLAAIIYCEAGNQGYEGQLAVGAVVCNRVRSGSYPNNIHDVVYQKGQFGPATNGSLSKALSNGVNENCRKAAIDALAGSTNVGNALHFRRAGGREGVVIGDHVFY